MAVIHAYRRKKTYGYEFPGYPPMSFEPNEKGDCVCEVEDHAIAARLLQVPEAFRIYGAEDGESSVAALLQASAGAAPSPYVLISGDRSIDLRLLSDPDLQAFAVANGIKVNARNKGDKVRDKIVEHFTTKE